jgi:hypothetical protein
MKMGDEKFPSVNQNEIVGVGAPIGTSAIRALKFGDVKGRIEFEGDLACEGLRGRGKIKTV